MKKQIKTTNGITAIYVDRILYPNTPHSFALHKKIYPASDIKLI